MDGVDGLARGMPGLTSLEIGRSWARGVGGVDVANFIELVE